MNRSWKLMVGAAALFLVAHCATISGAAAGAVTVQPETLVEFKGWGIFPAPYDRKMPTYANGSPAYGDATWLPTTGNEPGHLHKTVGSLGFDIARIGLSPLTGRPDGTLDPDRLGDLKDHLVLLKRIGITNYFLTQWSPPAHMKSPDRVRYGKFEGRKQTLDPAFADGEGYDMADYLADVCAALVKEGFPAPLAISIQNEPDVDQIYDSCVYNETAEQGAVYRRVVKQLRAKLDRKGLNKTIILVTEDSGSGGMARILGEPSAGGFAAMREDPELTRAVGGFAFHQYYTSDRVKSLRAAMGAYAGRDRWMTEISDDATPMRNEERAESGNEELDVALDMFRRMAADFTDFCVNYWFWWRAWHSTGGKGYPAQDLVFNDGDGPATVMKLGEAFRLLWTTVQPGWKVKATKVEGVDLRTDNETIINDSEPNGSMMSRGADVLAFEQHAEQRSCVVLINASAKTRSIASLTGLLGATSDVHRLDKNGLKQTATATGIIRGSLQGIDLPAHSITFVITKAAQR